MSEIAIEIESMSKSYRGEGEIVHVIRDLDLTVPLGQIVSVEGASGVGKSTLLHIVGSIDTPVEGKVRIFGEEITSMTERQKENFRAANVGLIFQHHYLLPDFTVLENVIMPLWIQRKNVSKSTDNAIEMLKNVGLGHRLHHYPSQISGGEMARAGVARALVGGKKLILADEPTGNLDRDNSEKLADLLWKLQEQLGFTMLIVTHDQDLAARVPRRFRLKEGHLEPFS
ncbi:MAG: lipoprotein-releasing system ATP-binding protein LolD [Spirochaetaceae bacterium]|nr:lipoprotein-releasing system ATP-binding protein LolD [Spirochaetaceae bacterium]|tara:strand:- start:79354 stop:80037 length:684 start_codon:yes stop_codon:yes gene_type:complete